MNSATIYNNVPTPPCMQIPLSVATPDGGILYTGFKCINYIGAPPSNEKEKDAAATEVKTMSTRITVNALDVSPLWNKPDKSESSQNHGKHFAIVAEDLSVQVWDCALGEAIIGHKAHQHQHEARDVRMQPSINVFLSYICNGNLLSIDASDLVIYCVASNSYCRRPMFISPRNNQLSVLRCSPYDENLFALGTMSGVVMVCDLRKMSIVYKLNAHGQNASVCDLAWREMALHKVDSNAANTNTATDKDEQWRSSAVIPVKAPLVKSKAAECDDPFDIYNFDHLESEFGAPASVRPRLTSKSSDDCGDFIGLEKPADSVTIDYREACESMKADLMAHRIPTNETPQVEVTLHDCQQTETLCPRSDSSHNNSHNSQKEDGTPVSGSSEGSLEVIQFSSSSDDAVIVDGDAAKPKREVLHHIYHQAEVHDAPESPKLVPQTTNQLYSSAKLIKQTPIETTSVSSFDSVGRPDVLLVSINENDILTIWNTVTGAHCGKNYSKNNATGKFKKVHWLNEHTIVSLSRQQLQFWSIGYDAKLLRYKLQKDHQNKCSVQDIITIAPSEATQHIWLCTKNRRTTFWNSKIGHVSASYGCLAFGVRAIAECPDDMNKIAIGCSDKRLALFDVSKLSARCIPIDSLFVNSIVYSLAWSPDCLQLAYGTYDGTVGILDVERMRVKTTFRPVHKNEIYSLMWQDNYIYFIVNHVLGIYDVRQPKKDAILLKHIERPSYLSVRGSFLFIGTEDGFLQLYERKPGAELAYMSQRQTPLLARYVTDIAFNPLERNQFAVVGHDKLLYVMEFKAEQRGWTKLHMFTASDKKASITSVKWSNFSSHLLLSFHIEGKVCLWSTKEPQQPPLTITYHCPMWCGIFMPTNENIIMCGGKTLSLELVSIQEALARNDKNIYSKMDALLKVKWASKTQTQPCVPQLNATQKKREHRDKRKAVQVQLPPAAIEQITNSQQALDPAESACEQAPLETMLGALSLDTRRTSTNAAVVCSKCKELDSQAMPDSFLAHSRTCLCLTLRELNRNALDKLAIVLTEDAAKIDKNVLMSKLFSSKVMAKDLIATELANLKQSNSKNIAPLCLAVSTFKLRDELQQHIEHNTLNEWHVSVAPAVSYVFWQKCCKAYALQMEKQGYILHAATYLSVIDMQVEAINMLLEHEYFREALVNARIHLPATDPLIKTIINKWLGQLEKTGNFAAAALICVLDNEMLRGYLFLRKFRNCTPEIADLMEQIKRIGQLAPLFDDGCPEKAENGSEMLNEEAA